MRNLLVSVLAIPIVASLSGCAGMMSGVGGSDSFGCKAPDGVSCLSVSGVYANSIQNNLPSQNKGDPKDGNGNAVPAFSVPRADVRASLSSGSPMRAAARNLRVWIAPWEDGEGDFRDQSHVYVTVDNGRWLLEHNQRAIASAFAPSRPARFSPFSSGSPREAAVPPAPATGGIQAF